MFAKQPLGHLITNSVYPKMAYWTSQLVEGDAHREAAGPHTLEIRKPVTGSGTPIHLLNGTDTDTYTEPNERQQYPPTHQPLVSSHRHRQGSQTGGHASIQAFIPRLGARTRANPPLLVLLEGD